MAFAKRKERIAFDARMVGPLRRHRIGDAVLDLPTPFALLGGREELVNGHQALRCIRHAAILAHRRAPRYPARRPNQRFTRAA